jgi:hypothetical protein
VAVEALATGTAPELPNPGNPHMSREQQEQLGLKAAAEVYQQMPVLPDSSPETKYIQALGTRLYTTIPPEHSWPFQFHVVAQKEINAFALPGGPMFVNLGTITASDNEAELAGVMAHEMSHVYMQHSAKQQEKASVLDTLAGIAGAVAETRGGAMGALAESGIEVGAGTLMLKYSRGDEAQADAVGAIILWKAGYNPVALAEFFEKLAAQGGTGPQFLSDHPNPGNRRAAIEREIAEWPVKQYRQDSPEFAAVRKQAASVPSYSAQEIADGAKSGRWAAENRKNGAIFPGAAAEPSRTASVANAAFVPQPQVTDVQASSNFRTADLGAMKIDYPENWEVVAGQQPSSVTIAPKAGLAGSAVAYGAVIQAVKVPKGKISSQELTALIAHSFEASDSNMKQSGEIESITVNGLDGGSADLETVSPVAGADQKSQAERDWLVAVPRGEGRAIFMTFVAPKAHFEQMKPTFEKMLESVQFRSE